MALTNRVKYQYLLTFIVDAVAMLCSFFAAYLLFGAVLKLVLDYATFDRLHYIGVLIVAFSATFVCFDQSENITLRKWNRELFIVCRFNVVFVALTSALMLTTKAGMIDSRYMVLGVPIFNIVFMLLGHQLLKRYLQENSNKNMTSRLVGVVSTKERAPELISALEKDWTKTLHGLALLDATSAEVGTSFGSMKIEANFNGFMEWIRRDALDEIYIDIPLDTGSSLVPYMKELESMGVDIHLNLPILERLNGSDDWTEHFHPSVEHCGSISLLALNYNQRTMTEVILKRLMDIVGGLIGCILSAPIIAIVAIPLKLESPGPLFFKQKRVGLNGRYFYIYKLRSMYRDAEARKKELLSQNEMNGLMFKITDDPRITKVGRFIRRTSIDELPQFWNALNGTMSLVGTRPPTVDEYERYESHHKRRLSMKPGITGAWQVSGRSNIENFEDVVKMDVAYIDNWSFWLDIKILFKTIAVVFCGRGAK